VFLPAAHAIFGKVATSAIKEGVSQLIKSKYYMVLLYRLEACTLNKEENRSIDLKASRFFSRNCFVQLTQK